MAAGSWKNIKVRNEVVDMASKLFAEGNTVREAAVFAVDGFHGFTMEFSSSPTAHADEYDEIEQILIDSNFILRSENRGMSCVCS